MIPHPHLLDRHHHPNPNPSPNLHHPSTIPNSNPKTPPPKSHLHCNRGRHGQGRRTAASVVSEGHSTVLVLPRDKFISLCEQHPRLLRLVASRLDAYTDFNFLMSTALLQQAPLALLQAVVARAVQQSIPAHTRLQAEGEPCEALHLVRSGRLVVSCRASIYGAGGGGMGGAALDGTTAAAPPLVTLSSLDLFGAEAAAEEGEGGGAGVGSMRARYTVCTGTECELLSLPRSGSSGLTLATSCSLITGPLPLPRTSRRRPCPFPSCSAYRRQRALAAFCTLLSDLSPPTSHLHPLPSSTKSPLTPPSIPSYLSSHGPPLTSHHPLLSPLTQRYASSSWPTPSLLACSLLPTKPPQPPCCLPIA